MKFVIAILYTLTVFGCATSVSKKVEDDIAQQTVITNRQAMMSGLGAIGQSKNLTDDQKEKIVSLMDRTRMQMGALRRNEAQAKASLFKYIATGEFDDEQIREYRKQLVNLENQKMDIMFSNIVETRKILGKKAFDKQQYPELMDIFQFHANVE